MRCAKAFFIGLNKTGTNSIHRLLRELGVRSCKRKHWSGPAPRPELLAEHDAFLDGMPPIDFASLDRQFPGSKFVLNVRPLGQWLLSRMRHVARNKADPKYAGDWLDNEESDVVRWIVTRQRHHGAVLRHFRRRPDDLLIVDYCNDPDAHVKIVDFLGLDAEVHGPVRPWENRAVSDPDRTEHHEAVTRRAADRLDLTQRDLCEPVLVPSLPAE